MHTRAFSIVWAVGVLLAAVPVPAWADAAIGLIILRTYDASGLPDTDRSAALAAAAGILEEAGLAVRRLACDHREDARAVQPCQTPLQPHELSLRLVRLPPVGPAALRLRSGHPERESRGEAGHHVRDGQPVTLGYSLVETPARFGSLATVYVDRVARLAEASRVDLPTLLGRAIAHEVGHLLLGTTAHAPAGVMRAVWSPDAIQGRPAREWRFTPRDAEALRAGARRRTGHALHSL